MTREDLRSELEKEPFVPLLLHLVSGAVIPVDEPGDATVLKNSVLVLHAHDPRLDEAGYDVIDLRNIERIERVGYNWRSDVEGAGAS